MNLARAIPLILLFPSSKIMWTLGWGRVSTRWGPASPKSHSTTQKCSTHGFQVARGMVAHVPEAPRLDHGGLEDTPRGFCLAASHVASRFCKTRRRTGPIMGLQRELKGSVC